MSLMVDAGESQIPSHHGRSFCFGSCSEERGLNNFIVGLHGWGIILRIGSLIICFKLLVSLRLETFPCLPNSDAFFRNQG